MVGSNNSSIDMTVDWVLNLFVKSAVVVPQYVGA